MVSSELIFHRINLTVPNVWCLNSGKSCGAFYAIKIFLLALFLKTPGCFRYLKPFSVSYRLTHHAPSFRTQQQFK